MRGKYGNVFTEREKKDKKVKAKRTRKSDR